MRRLALIVIVSLSLCGAGAAQDLVTPSDRVTTHVNIRATADEDAAEIGQLHIRQALPLVRSVPRFYEVQVSAGQTGFVSKSWSTVSRALVPRQQNELRIHFLNIGAGSCAVVECPGPNAAPMVVDCGSTGATSVDMDGQQTRAYVQNVLSQHQSAPNVVLSHADLDHYSYVPNALNTVAAASVWQGGDPADYTAAGFPAWLTAQQTGGAALHRNFAADFHNNRQPVSADISCGLASTFVFTVNSGNSNNANSLVLMIEYEDFTVVLTGDAEGTTQARSIQNFANSVKASVITTSHHGASTLGSNSQEWAEATSPAVLISSAGNRFFHPRCVASNRFTSVATTKTHDVRCGTTNSYTTGRTNRAHYVTEVSGAVVITSSGKSPMMVNCSRSVECGVRIPH